ncbi:MAG: hypothetical protein GX337_01145 [Christensenellaceae bacterium]|nr:hypothetical protein [Christensenellaceae bacterium]
MQINGIMLPTPLSLKYQGMVSGEAQIIKYIISADWAMLSKTDMVNLLDETTCVINIEDPALGAKRQISAKLKGIRCLKHGENYRDIEAQWQEE